jgi:hypothetical protein
VVHPSSAAGGRDDRATDRDDRADHRDVAARDRDDAARQRDTDADERSTAAQADALDLADRLHRITVEVLQRLARIEDGGLDHAEWSDLAPAALARLDALVAEQQALARRDRQAVRALLDDLHDAVGELRSDHRALSQDRRAAGRDRHHSSRDRDDAGQDRRDAQADRDQAAVDRELVPPAEVPGPPADGDGAAAPPGSPDPMTSRYARAIAVSRQRIAESRVHLSRADRTRTVRPGSDHAPASPGPGS